MKLIDTHCHYNMPPLVDSWQEYWRTAQEYGVVGAVVVGTKVETSDLALTLAHEEPKLLAAVGVHPTHAHEITLAQLEAAGKNWAEEQFSAVGETGLDYYRLQREPAEFEASVNQQKEIFRWHIHFAQEHNKPLILHVRDTGEQAYFDALEILKKEYTGSKPFVLHCASGPREYIKEAIAMGGYVGFDGNITYPSAGDIRDLVKSVPADRLMIETDAPFLAPQKFRGKTCEPWMIAQTAEYVQRELNLNLDQIFENSQRFFGHSFTE